MVDPVGIKTAAVADRRLAPVASEAVAETQRVKPAQAEAQQAVSSTLVSRSMASKPPVDTDRVAQIRKAVQDGRFPLIPSTIADRLIALKMEWNPND
jgi:negative regulator of flagellin synthesis FlgM